MEQNQSFSVECMWKCCDVGGGGGGGCRGTLGAAMISAGQVDFLAETDENGNKTKKEMVVKKLLMWYRSATL